MSFNLQHLIHSLNSLKAIIANRLQIFFAQEEIKLLFQIPDLKINSDNSELNHFLKQYQPNPEEYFILILALAPHLQPNFIEAIVQEFLPNGGDLVEMGGAKGETYRGMLPTGETAQFILAGNDIAERIRIAQYFFTEHFFYKEGILKLESVKEGEPKMSGRIILSQEYVDLFTIGKITAPAFGPDFPAKRIFSPMEWDDLVLREQCRQQIEDLKMWLEHHHHLAQDAVIRRKLKPGYRVLFYGPSGTGKTLTAILLGKQFGKEVYRIDLSLVVSKYIGETEKNLEKIFAKAESKNWILFFDEADALFSKRSNVSSAHDKFANQEVSYLLQRVEDYQGLIILASNFKNNLDSAFIRRFNDIIHFLKPDVSERQILWEKNLPQSLNLDEQLDLKTLSAKYELSGSAISNAMHYACLCAFSRNGKQIIQQQDLLAGIRRELLKEDKLF
jgi:AAA+ superfamily predicted ATPase